MLATCLTSDGEKGLKSVTSDRLKTFQMDVTNSQQIKEVFEEVKKEVACGRSLGYALCPCLRGTWGLTVLRYWAFFQGHPTRI